MEAGIERLLSLARRDGLECEVYAEQVSRFQVEVFRGTAESVDRAVDGGLALRLAGGDRVGAACTSATGDGGIDLVYDEARANLRASSPVAADILAEYREAPARKDPFPRLPTGESRERRIDGARAMEAACYEFDERIHNTEGAFYAEWIEDVRVAGTRGIRRREQRGGCSCFVAALARRGGETRTGWHHGQAQHPNDLDFGEVGREAARRAVALLGSKPGATGRFPVVLDAPAAVDIVGLAGRALSAEAAVRGMSVFAGSARSHIADPAVSVTDDPFLPGGCFNASFDAEGMPKKRVSLIDGGRLRGFLQTAYSAKRMGVEATGNAVRESFRHPPSPGPSNLSIEPGEEPIEALWAAAEDGVYVSDVMGMHTADPISGDFSVGINGFRIRGGMPAEPIGETTLSGNLLQLLGGVRLVGRGRVFIGPYGAPPLLIEGLSVSGT